MVGKKGRRFGGGPCGAVEGIPKRDRRRRRAIPASSFGKTLNLMKGEISQRRSQKRSQFAYRAGGFSRWKRIRKGKCAEWGRALKGEGGGGES